ncbi:hypothetical protein AVEN_178152-1 [Araneus ventricosus]|uniref:Uncharacterized protein n=1 Tax=Araneus ventricosus TaxID=182803 RepID=A0A4Y2GB29_ARAVE|nr:hypothetical protein AVEN_178152-1 [Araneus ventricosus]
MDHVVTIGHNFYQRGFQESNDTRIPLSYQPQRIVIWKVDEYGCYAYHVLLSITEVFFCDTMDELTGGLNEIPRNFTDGRLVCLGTVDGQALVRRPHESIFRTLSDVAIKSQKNWFGEGFRVAVRVSWLYSQRP